MRSSWRRAAGLTRSVSESIQEVKGESLLDLLEHARILRDTHAQQLLRSPVLIEHIVSVLPQLLHVRADEHLAQLDEITMILIIHLDDTPGVRTSADLASIGRSNDLVGADNSKGDL